jgi:hypothetical protein
MLTYPSQKAESVAATRRGQALSREENRATVDATIPERVPSNAGARLSEGEPADAAARPRKRSEIHFLR